MKRRKPTRTELLAVIDRLQGLIGEALAAVGNDRSPNRLAETQGPLEEAHELCVLARAADPPCSADALTRSDRRFPIRPRART